MAGEACTAYGNDIMDLSLTVQHQDADRLNVRIKPRYIVRSNPNLGTFAPLTRG